MFPAHSPEVCFALVLEVITSICILNAHIRTAEVGIMINNTVHLTIPVKLAYCCGTIVGPDATGNCLCQYTCPSTSRAMDNIIAKTSNRNLAEKVDG